MSCSFLHSLLDFLQLLTVTDGDLSGCVSWVSGLWQPGVVLYHMIDYSLHKLFTSHSSFNCIPVLDTAGHCIIGHSRMNLIIHFLKTRRVEQLSFSLVFSLFTGSIKACIYRS